MADAEQVVPDPTGASENHNDSPNNLIDGEGESEYSKMKKRKGETYFFIVIELMRTVIRSGTATV